MIRSLVSGEWGVGESTAAAGTAGTTTTTTGPARGTASRAVGVWGGETLGGGNPLLRHFMSKRGGAEYVALATAEPVTTKAASAEVATITAAPSMRSLTSAADGVLLDPPKQHPSDYNLADLNGRGSRSAANEHHTLLLSAPFWACITYSIASVAMIILNKLVLNTYGFDFPMVLLLHQNLTTVISLYIARYLDLLNFEDLDRQRIIKWLPVDVFFVAMLVTGAFSVQLLSVPMVTIFKNTNNIFIAVGDGLIYGNFPSRGVMYALLLMLLAAVMAAANDLEFTSRGYAWTLGNCLASTAFVLYTQSAIARTNLSTFGKVYINNLLAIPLVVVADVVAIGDLKRLATLDSERVATFINFEFFTVWMLSGFIGFALSAVSLRAQKLTSPTTYSMVGALNKIPLAMFGAMLFRTPMTNKGVVYVSISIVSGAWYSWVKAREEMQKRADAAAAAVANSNASAAAAAVAAGTTPSGAALTSPASSVAVAGESIASASGGGGAAAGGGSSAGSRGRGPSMDDEMGGAHHRAGRGARAKSLPSNAVDVNLVTSSGGVMGGAQA